MQFNGLPYGISAMNKHKDNFHNSRYTDSVSLDGREYTEFYDWEQFVDVNSRELLLYARLMADTAKHARQVVIDALSSLMVCVLDGDVTGGERRYLQYAYTLIRMLVSEHAWLRPDSEIAAEPDEVFFCNEPEDEETFLSLTRKQREIILLRVRAGFDFSEIAEITGKSLMAVNLIYREGMKAIQNKLNCVA